MAAAHSTMSKKRYHEYASLVLKTVDDPQVAEALLAGLREILKFDPTLKLESTSKSTPYDEKHAQRIKNYRQRLKEKGISTYISSGAKAHYHAKKQSAT